MPLYEYRCGDGHLTETYAPMQQVRSRVRCLCGKQAARIYTPPGLRSPYREHFNHSVGAYVGSDRDFREHLKRGSERMSQRLGVDTNYVPVDGADREALGVTGEGLESQERAWRNRPGVEGERSVIDLGSPST